MKNKSILLFFVCIAPVLIYAQISGDQNNPAITQAERDKLVNVPTNTNTELSNKLNVGSTTAAISPSSDRQYLTDAEQSSIQNIPSDTNSALNLKANLSSAIFTGDVFFQQDGPNNVVIKSGLNTTSNAGIVFQNAALSNTAIIQREVQGTDNADLVIKTGLNTDPLLLTEVARFRNNVGPAATQNDVVITNDLHAVGLIQNGNNVLDTSDITTDINSLSGRIPDAPTVKSYVDSSSAFNGGTITTPLIVESGVDNQALLNLKRTDNSIDQGLAFQNSGSNYTFSFYQDFSDSDAIKLSMGSNADVTLLTEIMRITPSLVSVIPIGADFHVNGDVFAFNSGNMAATDITAVGSFVGIDYRLNGSATDSNWSLYKAAQGATSGPDGTINANGLSFSGNAIRTRVPASATQGYIIENSNGENLFEVNGGNGTVSVPNNLLLYEESSLRLRDENNNTYDFEKTPGSTGIRLRAVTNPPNGSPMFRIDSSGGGNRLYAKQNEDSGTGNTDFKVGVDNNLDGGNFVFHEGNRGLATQLEVYLSTTGTDNPLPTFNTALLNSFKGKTTALIGVGALAAQMPSISDFGTSNGDYDHGETFTLLNGNNGGTITLNLPSSYNFMINGLNNVNSGNVVITGPGQLTFIAVDGTSFTPNLGNKTWLVIDPAI